jgi:hypothetical protein
MRWLSTAARTVAPKRVLSSRKISKAAMTSDTAIRKIR